MNLLLLILVYAVQIGTYSLYLETQKADMTEESDDAEEASNEPKLLILPDETEESQKHKPIRCDRIPMHLISPESTDDAGEHYHLTLIHNTVLNCMLKPCDEATACIREIPSDIVAAAIEDLKANSQIKRTDEENESQEYLYTNPLRAIYEMSVCDKALDAFESINKHIITSYGYAHSTVLGRFMTIPVEAISHSDCEDILSYLVHAYSPCTLGNSHLDMMKIMASNTGIAEFSYQVLSYHKIYMRDDDKRDCIEDAIRLFSEIMVEVELEPGRDDVSLLDDSQPNSFLFPYPDFMLKKFKEELESLGEDEEDEDDEDRIIPGADRI